nr:MAG TPA: hypothetical protein [Caudoviricetes sp.]
MVYDYFTWRIDFILQRLDMYKCCIDYSWRNAMN